ncbi:hypothetical protein VKT23_009015 [Stygiomarasmius scandens]|uniref:Peptide hydrolase n=1 Tax=Marasmiellus scandens TaxID=2682957 RepID=A0ABR1JH38_9AGAR
MFQLRAKSWTRLALAAVVLSTFTLVDASWDDQVILGSNQNDEFNLDSLITRWPIKNQAVYASPSGEFQSGRVFGMSDLRVYGLNAMRAVQVDSGSESPFQWITEAVKLRLKAEGKDIWDVTETVLASDTYKAAPNPKFSYPSAPKANETVRSIFPYISTEEQKSNIATFTNTSVFQTRYYNSEWGRNSSIWLARKAASYVKELGGYAEEANVQIEVIRWEHRWLQDSVVVRFIPLDASEEPVTIIGAHCDSLNHENPLYTAPGADDDGSGTVTILEALRSLLAAKYVPKSPLEFQFYAAEEGGLLGSQVIAAEYVKQGREVRGMQQYDATAWVKPGVPERIGVMMSTIDEALTDFQIMLIDEYIDIPYIRAQYPGRASSDHASWHNAGYPACHVTENRFEDMNPNMHSPFDTFTLPDYSFDHMLKFTKLAVAFAVEMTS